MLQQKNLPKNLSDIEKREQGFVTVNHSLEILLKMNSAFPHTIAIHNNKVIGYALSMLPSFGNEIDILKPMFNEIEKIINNDKFLVMGQICVEKEYRGKGVFKCLYKNMIKSSKAAGYSKIITEIDALNLRSLKAHEIIGFKPINNYKIENKNWVIVELDI